MPFYRLIGLFLFFSLSTQVLFAQEEGEQLVELNVVNEKGHAINDAYVINQANGKLVGLTFQGKLSFMAKLPLQLRVSHISYENRNIAIDQSDERKGIITKSVTLKTSITSLGEVEIKASGNDLAYTKEEAYVADYVFYESSILLLLGIGNKRVLRLIDENSNTIYERSIRAKGINLEMDCFKNIHLKAKDSIYQILFTDTSFSLLNPYPIKEFENTLQRCKANLDQNIILEYTDQYKQEIHYYIKEKQESDYQILRKIRDLEAQMGFNFFASKYGRFEEAGLSSASANNRKELNDVRELDRAFAYYKHVITQPLYCPIFKFNTYFLLFDHFNSSLVYYDRNGTRLDSLSIDYHQKEKWNHQLLQDYYTDEIYAVFERGNLLEVKKIDLSSGALTKLSVKSKKRFPSKLRIRDQKLYYLQKDLYKPGLPQQLFVVDIK